jgi:hypothetical protein
MRWDIALHGFPVEVTLIRDAASMVKLREIDFVRQVLESSEVFFETRNFK